MENIKTNTQILKEAQDIVDGINKEKEEIEKILQFIDFLERKNFDSLDVEEINNEKKEVEKKIEIIDSLQKKYFDLVEEVKNKNKK
jgi:hypothetical protein